MKTTNICDMCDAIGFDYFQKIDEFIRIGDVTAIRHLKKQQYRKNYERGILMVALARLIKARRVLEFGTGRGYVCACLVGMVESIEEVVTIDKENPDVVVDKFSQLGLSLDKMKFVTGNANNLSKDDVSGEFDLVFIDAQHDGKSVKSNYEYAKSKCHDDTIIVFDDYRSKFPSVKSVIDKIKMNKIIIQTDGWVIENVCIDKARDADKVVKGKEFNSGMVVGTHENSIFKQFTEK